ncbi:MAG: Txe/YoeB family addiction module toxin [Oscillospiraceae bacterium]|nr:Txe/YoeB family addiction module toxin [Oscillospiraceae bacterium]
MFNIKYSKQALKDKEKLSGSLYDNAKMLIEILKNNPFENHPPYEKLTNRKDEYSRRINNKHRLWYAIDKKEKVVYILRMWTHYE